MTKRYFMKYVFVPKTDSYETSDMLYDRKTVYLIIFSFSQRCQVTKHDQQMSLSPGISL